MRWLTINLLLLTSYFITSTLLFFRSEEFGHLQSLWQFPMSLQLRLQWSVISPARLSVVFPLLTLLLCFFSSHKKPNQHFLKTLSFWVLRRLIEAVQKYGDPFLFSRLTAHYPTYMNFAHHPTYMNFICYLCIVQTLFFHRPYIHAARFSVF